MEEFDQHIKSQIDSLHEVPGGEFDEKGVWKRIKSNSNQNLLYFFGCILVISLAFIFFNRPETNRITAEVKKVEDHQPETLVDSSNTKPEVSLPLQSPEHAHSSQDFDKKTEEPEKITSLEASTSQPKKLIVQKLDKPTSPLTDSRISDSDHELSVSIAKGNRTVEVTQLKRLNNRFTFTYGIRSSRSFGTRFSEDGYLYRPFGFNQIQIPIGVRYNFLGRKRAFKPFLYAGFNNSLSLPSNNKSAGYNLNFESNLTLDYRIFSTRGGKKGYLRVRLPIFNYNIINTPGRYNVLEGTGQDN